MNLNLFDEEPVQPLNVPKLVSVPSTLDNIKGRPHGLAGTKPSAPSPSQRADGDWVLCVGHTFETLRMKVLSILPVFPGGSCVCHAGGKST